MFCAKCGSKIADEQKCCPSCGASLSNTSAPDGGTSVVVVKEKGGCVKGCLIAIIAVVVIGFALVMIIGDVASEKEKREIAESSAVTTEEMVRNREDLIAWIRNKENQTELERDDAFARRLKGKTVLFTGKVREVGKTLFSDEVFVSLTVGRLGALERINIQFNVRESQAALVKMWKKDEVHTMRGRITGQGFGSDDAECDIAEIVE